MLVHHADPDAGFTPAHWPADFVHAMLGRVVASFSGRDEPPAMRLHATDTDARHELGAPGPLIEGPSTALLAWLMGRSGGDDLTVHGAEALPEPPFLY